MVDFRNKARADFEKARHKALFHDVVSLITQKENSLFAFDEVKHLLSPYGAVYRGIQSVPVDKIVGSEGRYRDFDRHFLPKEDFTRDRWESIDVAHYQNVELPPVILYKIGDFYFVKDGNHRVSVAKEKGIEFIDAEVIELITKAPIEKIDEKELLIAESYNYFLEKTGFDRVYPDEKIKLTNPWSYVVLIDHINTYRYFLSQRKGKEVSMEEAIRDWYENLFKKVVEIIKKHNVLKHFPGRTEADLYIWIMDHWHYLKEKFGDISLEEAVDDFKKKYSRNLLYRLWEIVTSIFRRKEKYEKEENKPESASENKPSS